MEPKKFMFVLHDKPSIKLFNQARNKADRLDITMHDAIVEGLRLFVNTNYKQVLVAKEK